MTPYAIKKLVAGIALRNTDEQLIDYLQFFSKHFPIGEYNFVHVLEKEAYFVPLDLVNQDLLDMGKKDAINEARSELKKTVAGHWDGPLDNMEYHVEVGDPLDELTDAADDEDADLMVIGKRADTNQHMAFSKNIVRLADSNVLVVPEESRKQIERILVPVDFSENSTQALEMALSLREGLGEKPEIVALNIYQRPNLMSFKIDMTPEQFEKNIIANHEEGFDKYLSEKFPDHKDYIRPVLLQSDYKLARQIMEQADALDADLIIMGAKGQSRLASILLGSTTEAVLNLNNDIPTLIVKG